MRRGSAHRWSTDATVEIARRSARKAGAHHGRRPERATPEGPRESAVQGRAAQPAIGQRLRLRLDPAGQGILYVGFVIDVYARYIVGWRVNSTKKTDFLLNAWSRACRPQTGSGTAP